MTLEPTREEWLEARERIRHATPQAKLSVSLEGTASALTEAVLGPCPPEPEQIIDFLATWIEQNHPGTQVYRKTGLVVT